MPFPVESYIHKNNCSTCPKSKCLWLSLRSSHFRKSRTNIRMVFIYKKHTFNSITWTNVKDHHLGCKHNLSFILKCTANFLLKMTLIKLSGDFDKPLIFHLMHDMNARAHTLALSVWVFIVMLTLLKSH